MKDLGADAKPMRGTAIYVLIEGQLCGALLFCSKLKPEALPEIAKLRGNHVDRIAVMSGDTESAVAGVAEELGISEYYAELKPDEKLATLETIYNEEKKKNRGRRVAFCGDGLNDSAVIARADVGIAMGSGSAVTVENADVVIMDDSIARVNDMLAVAKSTTRVANQNIALSLGIKLAVVFAGLLLAEPSLELAVVADVGAAVVTVLNAMRAGSIR
jgi:Cd2+/Zn2+-exporting ATPase